MARPKKPPSPVQLGLALEAPLPPAPRSPLRASLPATPRRWRSAPGLLVAGVDEAGRGPLAGPVVAAAVILDELQPIQGLGDSKALSARLRERLFDEIRAKALACCIAEASVDEIDRLNILQATMLAMQRAVAGLRLAPQRVLVDGNRCPSLDMASEAIVKGDAKVAAISAASILAKVHRDRLCLALHAQHPQYGFDGHKGYPTAAHLAALAAHGACAAHRRSYAPVRAVLEAVPVAATDLVPGAARGAALPGVDRGTQDGPP